MVSAADRLTGLDQRAPGEGDGLAFLILILAFGHHEGHLAAATAFLLVHVSDSRSARQDVADEDRLEELEVLLAMKNPAKIEVRRGHRVLAHPERGRLQEGRRHGNTAALLLGQFGIEVNRVGIANRAGELAHFAPFDWHRKRFTGFADDTLVNCHRNTPSLQLRGNAFALSGHPISLRSSSFLSAGPGSMAPASSLQIQALGYKFPIIGRVAEGEL